MLTPHNKSDADIKQIETDNNARTTLNNKKKTKQKIYYKTVLLPIEVTYGNFCWGDGRICEHFSNEGGYPSCDLGFSPLKFNVVGWIPKPVGCLTLQEQLGYKDGYEEDYEDYDVIYKEVYMGV